MLHEGNNRFNEDLAQSAPLAINRSSLSAEMPMERAARNIFTDINFLGYNWTKWHPY